MQTHGTLSKCNQRGFGFIRSAKGEELFVHISAFSADRDGEPCEDQWCH